ncbi:MAG: hypothetical protein GF392_01100, partial [Candidatus Omnitrophica bacterium]|nr:hypothetical protein [Candidatus Omnitrophota bacterium]
MTRNEEYAAVYASTGEDEGIILEFDFSSDPMAAIEYFGSSSTNGVFAESVDVLTPLPLRLLSEKSKKDIIRRFADRSDDDIRILADSLGMSIDVVIAVINSFAAPGAGSWFADRTWIKNAWWREAAVSFGVGLMVLLSGFDMLAPLAAALAFWMPHLFFDNKAAARSLPVIALAGATYGAMFLALASPWGLLAIPALMLTHLAVNKKALGQMEETEKAAQRKRRILNNHRARFSDERIAEMIEFGSGNDYYLGIILYRESDAEQRGQIRDLLSAEGKRLLELHEFVKENAEEYGYLFQNPYGQRTEGERERTLLNKVQSIGKKKDIPAYGIETARGGVTTLLNIILEGKIRSREGSDNWGRLDDSLYPEVSGGSHGPYWVTFTEPAGDEWTRAENHVHYIVRNAEEKRDILSLLSRTARKGLITEEYRRSAGSKVVTYEDFIGESSRKAFEDAYSRSGDDRKIEAGTAGAPKEGMTAALGEGTDPEKTDSVANRTIFDHFMVAYVNSLEERVRTSEERLRDLEGRDSSPSIIIENEKDVVERARERARSAKEMIRDVNSAMLADEPLSMIEALRSMPGVLSADAGDYGESVLSGLESLSATQEWIKVDRDMTLILPEGSPLEEVFLPGGASGTFIPFSYNGGDGSFIVAREKALRDPYAALQVIVHETVHRSLDRKNYRSGMDDSEAFAFRALDEAYTETMNTAIMLSVLKREPELGRQILEGMTEKGIAGLLEEVDPETQLHVLSKKILEENNVYKMERGLLGAMREEGGIDVVMDFLERGDTAGLEDRYGSVWEDVKTVAAIDPSDRLRSPGFNAGMIMVSDSMGDPEMSGIARMIAETLASEEFEQAMMEWEVDFRDATGLDHYLEEDLIIEILQVKAAIELFEDYKESGGFDGNTVQEDLIAKIEEMGPVEFELVEGADEKRVTAGLSPAQNLALVRELLLRHRVGARVRAAKEAMGD